MIKISDTAEMGTSTVDEQNLEKKQNSPGKLQEQA